MRKTPKRKVERETSRRGRATAAKLIEFASKELDRVGPAKFDIDSVLRKSKISKGSLYHHFGSKNGLLVAVETQQFIKYLDDQNTLLRGLVETRKSAIEFLTLMTELWKHLVYPKIVNSERNASEQLSWLNMIETSQSS